MQNNIIHIFSKQGLNPAFAKANCSLIESNQSLFSNLDENSESYNVDMFRVLENLWEKKYKAKILKDEDHKWKSVEFESEQSLYLFNLKWSN